ncbi:MAG: hypothetical protein ACM3MA_01460 [Acidobacteriota bacterium]
MPARKKFAWKRPVSKHSTLYMTIFLVVAVAAGALIWIYRGALFAMEQQSSGSTTATTSQKETPEEKHQSS